MSCQNHPEVAASGTCAGCAEPFCPSCLVSVRGATYCAGCKTMAVSGVASQAVAVCRDAKAALGLAFVGLFCFGIIVGPVAIAKAQGARRQIAANPALGGTGWAHAAIAVGIAVFVFSILGLVAQFHAVASKF